MKIVKAEVFVTCPGRNFVTLKITTEDGITGLGDATLNGRELSVASYLQDHLCPQLIGRDAHRIEDIWQFFYKGAYWRRGPVTMSAISAVDMALWDIKAKAANMPLYQLLGGASREGVMVYCHTTGHSIDEALDDYARHQELGFKAIRVQCGIPGMKTTYGMSKGKGLAYEPATKGQWPEEQLWSTEKYLDFMPKLFDAVRNKFGFNEHLLHDMHHRLTPIEVCAGLPILLRCIRYVLAHTVLPICHQSAWLRRCTLICGSPISVSRNTWVIPNKCSKSSRTTGLSITAICIRETNRVLVSNSMKSWRRNIPMNLLIYQSHVWKMARCGTGKE